MAKLTEKRLIAVVEDMQEVINFDPPLTDKAKGRDVEGLTKLVTGHAGDVYPTDDLSEDTKAVFEELGVGPWLEAGKQGEEGEGESAGEEEGEGGEPEEYGRSPEQILKLGEAIDEGEEDEKALTDILEQEGINIDPDEYATWVEVAVLINEELKKREEAKGGSMATKKGAKKKTAAKKGASAAKRNGGGEERSPLGNHKMGTSGAAMDAALIAGSGETMAKIAKRAKVDPSRLKGHIQFLRSKHGVDIKVSDEGKVTVKRRGK